MNEGEIKMASVELVGDKDTKKRFFRLDLEFWVDFQRVKTLDIYIYIYEDSRIYIWIRDGSKLHLRNFDPIWN